MELGDDSDPVSGGGDGEEGEEGEEGEDSESEDEVEPVVDHEQKDCYHIMEDSDGEGETPTPQETKGGVQDVTTKDAQKQVETNELKKQDQKAGEVPNNAQEVKAEKVDAKNSTETGEEGKKKRQEKPKIERKKRLPEEVKEDATLPKIRKKAHEKAAAGSTGTEVKIEKKDTKKTEIEVQQPDITPEIVSDEDEEPPKKIEAATKGAHKDRSRLSLETRVENWKPIENLVWYWSIYMYIYDAILWLTMTP